MPDEHFQRTFDEILNGSPIVRAWMIDIQGRQAGYLLASVTWSNEFGGLTGGIIPAPGSTRLGLGVQALEQAMDELKRLDKVAGFRLKVASANAKASQHYKKMEFNPVPYDGW